VLIPSFLLAPIQEAAHAAEQVHAQPKGGDIFTELYKHVLPHQEGAIEIAGKQIPYFQLQYFQVGAVLFILLAFGWALLGLRSKRPNKVQRILIGFVMWVRDEMVFPILGHHHGQQLLPYFLSLFFFIAVSNLAGLFPGGATPTASIFVTAGLASLTFLMIVVGGMIAQGPIKFWLNLVPHGVPLFIWPIMFVVELIGLAVKPVALTIRLFANMTGGHLVVLSFMGLIFFFAESIHAAAYGVAVPAVGLAVFIMIIEAFVALLQAYIFTLLSINFVGASLHPEH